MHKRNRILKILKGVYPFLTVTNSQDTCSVTCASSLTRGNGTPGSDLLSDMRELKMAVNMKEVGDVQVCSLRLKNYGGGSEHILTVP